MNPGKNFEFELDVTILVALLLFVKMNVDLMPDFPRFEYGIPLLVG
jgi:hypothetical protein